MAAPKNGGEEVGFLELRCAPTPEMLSSIRRFVADFFKRPVGAEMTSRIEVATYELLDNATKGSKDGRARLQIEARREEKNDLVTIRTWNQATPWNLAVVTRAVKELETPNAQEQYLEVMRKTSKKPAGLGLWRIRAEEEMTLGYTVDKDLLCIEARLRMARAS